MEDNVKWTTTFDGRQPGQLSLLRGFKIRLCHDTVRAFSFNPNPANNPLVRTEYQALNN